MNGNHELPIEISQREERDCCAYPVQAYAFSFANERDRCRQRMIVEGLGYIRGGVFSTPDMEIINWF